MRDLYRSLALLETRLSETYGLSLNEAMVLCSSGEETVMAGVVVERTGLTASHASKMIRSVEEKGLLVRTLGEKDKRQMYFALTDKAKEKLEDIRKHGIEIPDLLLPFIPQETLQTGIGFINNVDTFLLTMAMTALGAETSIDKFKQAGAKPFYLAGILYVWLVFGGYAIVKLLF